MRRRAAARESDGRAELEHRLAEAEQTVAALRAELKRLNEHTLAVARQFEQEAAARAEAEAISEVIRNEHAQLVAQTAALRTKLETSHADAPRDSTADEQSENPAAE